MQLLISLSAIAADGTDTRQIWRRSVFFLTFPSQTDILNVYLIENLLDKRITR